MERGLCAGEAPDVVAGAGVGSHAPPAGRLRAAALGAEADSGAPERVVPVLGRGPLAGRQAARLHADAWRNRIVQDRHPLRWQQGVVDGTGTRKHSAY